ncbi:hypothetical protein ACH4E7_21885 [Kitasatospora sp. NPDC018058]|uniref:hypothetical protein n=1 Tax=Kitasatospora sp. NPDC018058 TaxID=3364025 RepID=UPI0037BE98EB
MNIRSTVAKAAIVGLFSTAALATVAPSAFAGQSPNTFGCFSTWGSTGSNAHCYDVTQNGDFQNAASCSASFDQQSDWIWISQGSTINGWGQVDCTFSINNSWINYTNP